LNIQREQEPKSPFIFTSERGASFSTAGFAGMVERAGTAAKLGGAPPYALACPRGCALANMAGNGCRHRKRVEQGGFKRQIRSCHFSPFHSALKDLEKALDRGCMNIVAHVLAVIKPCGDGGSVERQIFEQIETPFKQTTFIQRG
jgi:hypothetical protein